jgi:hypothetical protein
VGNYRRQNTHNPLRQFLEYGKAFDDDNINSIGSFAHNNDGVLSQWAVIDMLAIFHEIVGHFKRSSTPSNCLKEIQFNLGLPTVPTHHLQQDEPIQWNSSLYMLQRIKEQKMAIFSSWSNLQRKKKPSCSRQS